MNDQYRQTERLIKEVRGVGWIASAILIALLSLIALLVRHFGW